MSTLASKAMNVHELVADLIACALIEGNSGSFPAEQQTKAAKQRLLDEIERRSSEMRHLKAHGNETLARAVVTAAEALLEVLPVPNDYYGEEAQALREALDNTQKAND